MRTTADVAFAQAEQLLESLQAGCRRRAARGACRLQPRTTRSAAGRRQRNGRASRRLGRCGAWRVQPGAGAGARAAPGSRAASSAADRARICGRRAARPEAQSLRDRAASRPARHCSRRWMQFDRREFRAQDALRSAARSRSEQRLVDQLPDWLARAAAARAPSRCRCNSAIASWSSRSKRAQFIAAAEAHYAELLRLVQDARVAGMPIELRLSQRVAALPGLLERFANAARLRGSSVAAGAAALGRAAVRSGDSPAGRFARARVSAARASRADD